MINETMSSTAYKQLNQSKLNDDSTQTGDSRNTLLRILASLRTTSRCDMFEGGQKVQSSTASIEQKFFVSKRDINANSTQSGLDHKLLEKLFRSLFLAGRHETFEDGMESNFSKNLLFLIAIADESDMPFDIIGELVQHEQVSTEVASEALLWIGRIDNLRTQDIRRILLEECLLSSRSSRVKDAAGLGLATLDDPKSIPALQKAIAKEPVPELRENLEQVLEQLIETKTTHNGE